MWNPVTAAHGIAASAVSRSRNASCELPDANITLRATARRDRVADDRGGVGRRGRGQGVGIGEDPERRTAHGGRGVAHANCGSQARGRVEQLVGHPAERVEVHAAGERVGEHRREHVVAPAGDRGLAP